MVLCMGLWIRIGWVRDGITLLAVELSRMVTMGCWAAATPCLVARRRWLVKEGLAPYVGFIKYMDREASVCLFMRAGRR